MPKLPPVERESVRTKVKRTPEAIRKLLMPVRDVELRADEDSDDFSDISDKYKDVHEENYFLTKTKWSKTEIDNFVVNQFSDDYKNTIARVRKELKV